MTINDPPDRPLNEAAVDWVFERAPIPHPVPPGHPAGPALMMTLLVLAASSDSDGRVTMTAGEIAAGTDLSTRHVYRTVAYLVELGVIERDGNDYRVLFTKGDAR